MFASFFQCGVGWSSVAGRRWLLVGGSSVVRRRRSHGGAVHMVLERDPVELLARRENLLQVEVLVQIKTGKNLSIHVVGAVGRARGSGVGGWSASDLPRERVVHATGGPPVPVQLERVRVNDDTCQLSTRGVIQRFINRKRTADAYKGVFRSEMVHVKY